VLFSLKSFASEPREPITLVVCHSVSLLSHCNTQLLSQASDEVQTLDRVSNSWRTFGGWKNQLKFMALIYKSESVMKNNLSYLDPLLGAKSTYSSQKCVLRMT
jgi:hypothetical protein